MNCYTIVVHVLHCITATLTKRNYCMFVSASTFYKHPANYYWPLFSLRHTLDDSLILVGVTSF